MSTTQDDPVTTGIGGAWNVTWRGGVLPLTKATLALDPSGDAVSVQLETDAGATSGEGTLDGNRASWTSDLSDGTRLWFSVVFENDRLTGDVTKDAEATSWETSSLVGVRVGAEVRTEPREGADALGESLIASGVEYIFGYCCAGANLPTVLDQVPNLAARTELAAAWMTYGYNRVKRRSAAGTLVWCVGAMHASPVVHAAKLDSTPLLFMTLEAGSASWDVRDILQDSTDVYSALRPLSKYIERLVTAEDVPLAVRQAVTAASTGKPGPAVLVLSPDAMNEKTSIETEPLVLPMPPAASEQGLDEVVEMIGNAKNPVLLAGAGVQMADARSELRELVDLTGIPVVSSGPASRGVLPEDHPLYAGDMGPWGYFPTGTEIAEKADLWVAVGFSFSQTATMSWSVDKPDKVIHVDVSEDQLGRIFQPSLGLVADAKMFLRQLTDRLKADGAKPVDPSDSPLVDDIAAVKGAYFDNLASFVGRDPIIPAAIGQALADEVPADTILVNDEGFMVPGMVYREDKYPNGFAAPLGFHYSSLGSTLPVAIGAKLAAPDRLVVSVGGDAGFYYDCADLSLVAELNLKMVVILVNNGGLYGGSRGRVSGERSNAIPLRHWVDQPDTDFTAIAQGFGLDAERVEKADELVPAIRRAIAADGPSFVEVVASASSMHLLLAAAGANAMSENPKKFGHGDPSPEGSWPS